MKQSNQIGNTPLLRISDKLYAKIETCNPSGSFKDRLVSYILNKAERNYLVKKGDTIIESTSGNTGIALAMLGAERGYKIVIVMPKNISKEKKQMIKLLGAAIIEVDKNDFRQARKIRDLNAKRHDWFCTNQHYNPLCIECYKKTIGAEILKQVRYLKQDISAVILISGTGGMFLGIKRALMESFPKIQFVLVEPIHSTNAFNSEESNSNGLLGLGGGKNFFLEHEQINEIITLSADEARMKTLQLMKCKGLWVGIPSGANILASERWIKKNKPKGIVVTVIGDRADRYVSYL